MSDAAFGNTTNGGPVQIRVHLVALLDRRAVEDQIGSHYRYPLVDITECAHSDGNHLLADDLAQWLAPLFVFFFQPS